LSFLSPRIRVWLSESIHSDRHRQADELVHVTNLIQETGESMMRMAAMSDFSMLDERARRARQTSDLKTLKKIQEDYKRLSKFMDDKEEKEGSS